MVGWGPNDIQKVTYRETSIAIRINIIFGPKNTSFRANLQVFAYVAVCDWSINQYIVFLKFKQL